MEQELTTTSEAQAPSLMRSMASKYGMDARKFEKVMRATSLPAKGNVTNEQFAAFLLVANEYELNPLTKEIFAFPAKNGGIQPVVSIDGWMRMINSNPQFDGMEFDDLLDDKGNLVSITCRMYRKDRTHPVTVTEYMAECRRNTDVWKQWPARMLRHKAAIQAARYAFGFSGIVDQDEAERAKNGAAPVDVQTVDAQDTGPAALTEYQLNELYDLLEATETDPSEIVSIVLGYEDEKSDLSDLKPGAQFDNAKAALTLRLRQQKGGA